MSLAWSGTEARSSPPVGTGASKVKAVGAPTAPMPSSVDVPSWKQRPKFVFVVTAPMPLAACTMKRIFPRSAAFSDNVPVHVPMPVAFAGGLSVRDCHAPC